MKEQRDTTQPAGGSPVERVVRPCPWCGSPAEVEDDFARNWWVQCTNLEACGCTDGRLYESAAEAVRMWNRTPCAHHFRRLTPVGAGDGNTFVVG